MSRYIDTDKAFEVLTDYYHHKTTIQSISLKEALGRVPTADVVEVRHGKWIKMSDADGVYWACSECGEDIPRISHYNPQFDLFPRLESIDKTKFCPNCGADMRERGEDG